MNTNTASLTSSRNRRRTLSVRPRASHIEPLEARIAPASTLSITGTGSENVVVDLAAHTITGIGSPADYSGSDVVDISKVSTLTIKGTPGDDSIAYTPADATGGTVTTDGPNPVIHFSSVSGVFAIDSLGGADTITVNGSSGNDFIVAKSGASPTVQVGNAKALTLVPANTQSLVITSSSGDDQLTVDSTAGAFSIPITYRGGSGFDTLVLKGGIADSSRYDQGSTPDSGTISLAFGTATQTINFAEIEPITDNVVAATLTINGTSANNVITYAKGPGGGSFVGNTGLVTVDNQESYEFNNKTTLVINGLAGADTFNLNNPTTPAGLTGVTVNGDGNDTANFSGTSGPVTITLGDTILASNTTVSGYSTPIKLIGVATANLDAGGQQMTATGTSQNDNIIYTPTGAAAGTFYDDLGSGNNPVPNTVFNIKSVSGNFRVFNDPGGSADQVTIQGTAARDLIEINQSAGVAQVLANNVTALLPVQLGVSVEILNARGLGGENTFQVIPAPGLAGQAQDNLLINVDGGTTGADNALIIGSSFGATPGTLAASVLALVNKSATANTGTVRVFNSAVANPDINYQNVQVVSPKVAGTSLNPNLLVIGPDLNEANDQLGTATFLGSSSSFEIPHATIFPSGSEFPGAPADTDFYRVVAQSTGKLDFQVSFRTFNPALLPGGGNLSLQVLDSSGNVLGTGTTDVSVAAVAGQSYFLHVSGTTANVINGYDATIINKGAGVIGNPGGGSNGDAFSTAGIYDLTKFTSGGKPAPGKGPSAVATGDLNGDGFADIVTANSKTRNLSILLNKGDGTFFDPVNILSGAKGPQDLVLADFDGDTKLDLVVSLPGATAIAFLKGDGTGGFAAPTLIKTPKFNPYALAVGDVNGDTKRDIVATSVATGAVEVLTGDGAGGFTPGTPVKTVGKKPVDVVVADINGDTKLDVATANMGTNDVSFFTGDGTGALAAPVRFAVGSHPTSLAVGDLDNDGDLDLAVSNSGSRFVSVLPGNGMVPAAMQFAPQIRVAVPGPHQSTSIVIGDFDGDGIPDLGLGNRVGPNFTILLGISPGVYSQPFEFNLGVDPLIGNTGAIAATDLNNDGLLDIVATGLSSNDVRVLIRKI